MSDPAPDRGDSIESHAVRPKKLGVVYSVRFSAEEAEYLRWHAEQRGATITGLIREQMRQLPPYVVTNKELSV